VVPVERPEDLLRVAQGDTVVCRAPLLAAVGICHLGIRRMAVSPSAYLHAVAHRDPRRPQRERLVVFVPGRNRSSQPGGSSG
jgi:hypothetical protein